MCVHFEPCGPFGPNPPNSRLSSLLWQSVHRICTPMFRPCVAPSRFSMFASKLGCGSALIRTCVTGWLELLAIANCGITLNMSVALTPITPFWEARVIGGTGNDATWPDACPLWQSAHVAWRVLFTTLLSAASCTLVPDINGCPTFGFAYSAKTFKAAGAMFVPPPWHA